MVLVKVLFHIFQGCILEALELYGPESLARGCLYEEWDLAGWGRVLLVRHTPRTVIYGPES